MNGTHITASGKRRKIISIKGNNTRQKTDFYGFCCGCSMKRTEWKRENAMKLKPVGMAPEK